MDKKVYHSHKKSTKTQAKERYKDLKTRYKETRPPLKKRVGKVLDRAKYPFVVANKKVGNKIHKKRNAIREIKVKMDYMINSLKATLNTTDEIRAKTIEDIVENLDNL